MKRGAARAFHIVSVFAALLLISPATLCAADNAMLALAGGGKAIRPIVISAQASDGTKAVAAELAEYLGRIGGAKFAIITGDGSQGIVLGTIGEFPNPALTQSLEIRNNYDGKEAFVIRTEPNRLLLLGATELGVSHAAFRLLDHLGCRWFFPAQEWEVVPRLNTISVALDETDRPRILARRIWYGYGAFGDKGHPRGGSTQKDYEAWARHNLMASSFRVNAGHAWQEIIAANKQAFIAHPEYLALVKGERKGEQLCVSNPAVRELAVKWALDYFAKNPGREMVSLECSDGDGQCECAACAKLGSVSDRVFGLANDAAKVVAAKYPGKMVGCLAYNQHSEPPQFTLEPNVYVQLTAGFIRGAYSFDQLAELWPQKCRSMGFYEYFSVWLWDFDKLPGGEGANIPRIREAVRRYAKLGATSIDAESGNNWGVHGLGYYVANKLMWNPDTDVDAVLSDFFEKAFGPAAPAMRDYYARWAPEGQPLMSRGLIGELFRDVEKAAQLAKDRPEVLARLDPVMHYLRYNHLRWQLDHEIDKSRQKELSVAVLTHAYRTRYEYMNHWAAMRNSFAGDAAQKFGEPTWTPNDPARKPWMNDQPVTREETMQWFGEGLDYFQPTPTAELKFAYDDLVPVHFPDAKPVPLIQACQRPERYALASLKGEPLDVEITVGTIAWYRDRPGAKWTLKDGKDKLIAQGQQKLDGEPHVLTFNVPSAGTYFFECEDSAAGWRIQVAAGRSAVWLAKRGVRLVPLGQCAERYFYVPRGTRRLQLFYTGTPCNILDGKNHVCAEIRTDDEIVSIPIPEGQDGQVWSLSPRTCTQFWLLNAPNVLAASPSALLLPRDLATKDALP